MSAMTFSDLTDILFENYGAMTIDNVVRQGPGNWLVPSESFLGRLREKGRVFIGGADGNDRYVRDWGIKVAGKTAASFGAADGYPVATQPTWDDANLPWARVGVMVEIDNLIRLATRRNALRGGLEGLGTQIADALKAIMHEIELELATDGSGNGGDDIDGFLAFLSTSNTYATIAQAGQALWQANITAAGSVALSKTLLRTLVRNAWNRNAIGPNTEIWMDLLQFQKFATLYEDSVRFVPGATAGTVIPHYADGSFLIPMKVIKGVPTSEVWMLNLDEIEFRFLDHTPEDQLSEVRDQEAMHEGHPIGFEQVQTGKDSKAIFVKAYGNLCCVNPYHQSAITGLATTAP